MGNTNARRKKVWNEQSQSKMFSRLKPKQRKIAKKLLYSIIALGFATAMVGIVLEAYIAISYQNNIKDYAQKIQKASVFLEKAFWKHRAEDGKQIPTERRNRNLVYLQMEGKRVTDKGVVAKALLTPNQITDEEHDELKEIFLYVVNTYFYIFYQEISYFYKLVEQKLANNIRIRDDMLDISSLFEDKRLKEKHISDKNFELLQFFANLAIMKDQTEQLQTLRVKYKIFLEKAPYYDATTWA